MRPGVSNCFRHLSPGSDPMTANGTASFSVKASVSDNPIRWLVSGGVLLIAAVAVGTAVMVGSFRERALDNAKRELENTVLLLSRHFDQQLTDFRAIQETSSRTCDPPKSIPANN